MRFSKTLAAQYPLHTSIDCKTARSVFFMPHAGTVKKFNIATSL
jgi:hypothetical protein